MGRPFDSEGGEGWKILSGQIIYFQHELDQKIYFQVYQGQTIYFYPQQKFENAEKKQTQNPPKVPLTSFRLRPSVHGENVEI